MMAGKKCLIGGLVILLVICSSAACTQKEAAKDANKPLKDKKPAEETKMETGVVKFINLEGGFYGIVGDTGQKYDPSNLPDKFKKDGMKVRFTAKEKKGAVSFRMWGKIVELTKIEEAGKGKSMPVKLQWLGHASFKIDYNDVTLYIDPWKIKDAAHNASIVLVSHSHYDHYSADDIARVSKPDTKLVGPNDVIQKQGKGQDVKPGQTIDISGLKITAVPSYNNTKQFHQKSNNWVGFVIEAGKTRIYYAGDTDLTSEMKELKDIDLALLPIGGTYTMDWKDAVEAVKNFKPKQAVPYHWGDIIGSKQDADQFSIKAACKVTVMKPGQTLTLAE